MILTTLSELQRAAYQADDHYRVELRRVYGSRASDARYFPRHVDKACQRAAERKQQADKAWLDAWQTSCLYPNNPDRYLSGV